DRDTGFFLIAIDDLVSLHDAMEFAATTVESRHQRPTEILMRVAEMGELPIEDRGDPAVMFKKVAKTIVAVNNRDPRWHRTVPVQPLAGPVEQRIIAIAWPAHESAPCGDLRALRLLAPRILIDHGFERRRLPVDVVKRGKNIDELGCDGASVSFAG